MKTRTIACVLSAVALSAMCLVGATGCQQSKGAVAATVNGTEIYEDTITNDIENMRKSNGYEDEAEWANYLSTYGYTSESIRETTIDSYVKKELIKLAAAENDVTVEDSEVQTIVDQTKSNYEDDDAWKKALEEVGLTEDEYKDNIKSSLLSSKLSDKVIEEEEPSDDDVLMYAQMYSAYSWNGAKKSSHILFAADDEKTAKDVLKQINSGKLDFAKAAKKYSTDTASASDGGNVGWDCLNSFVTEYTDALSKLKKGEVSDLVTSQFGIHIIKCTDVYNAPESITKISQVPTEMVDYLKKQIASYNKESKFDEWLDDYKEKADVVINPMPEGLPYYVDLGSSSSSSNADADDAAAAGDGSTGEATDDSKSESTDDSKDDSKSDSKSDSKDESKDSSKESSK